MLTIFYYFITVFKKIDNMFSHTVFSSSSNNRQTKCQQFFTYLSFILLTVYPPIPTAYPTTPSSLSYCTMHVYAAKIHETKCMCYFGASPAASNLFSLTLDITNNAQR